MTLAEFLAARYDETQAVAEAARVLREAEAGRKILAEIESELRDDPAAVMPQDRLRTLAAVWSDHPDYDEAWRP